MAMEGSPSPAAVTAVAAFLFAAVPYSVLALARVQQKRSEFPLNGREFSLIIPHAIGTLCSIIYYPLIGLFDHPPCAVALLFECHVHSVALAAILLRCLRLLFLHFASQALLRRHNKPESYIPTWFVDHRHYITPPFLLKALCCWAVTMILLSSLLFVFGPRVSTLATSLSDTLSDTTDCPTLSLIHVLVNAEAFVTFVALGVTAWRLRGVDDAYQIKQEILYLAITGLFTRGVLTVRRLSQIDATVGIPLTGLVASAFFCVTLYVITWYPLSLAKKEGEARDRRKRRRRKSLGKQRGRTGSTIVLDTVDTRDENVTSHADMGSRIDLGSRIEVGGSRHSRNSISLPDFISLPLHVLLLNENFKELRLDFEKHLTAEFAFENLLFWAEAGHFVECYDHRNSTEIAKHAVMLYNDFVRPGSPYQANFDSSHQKAFSRALKPALLAYERKNPTLDPNVTVEFTGHINKDVFDDGRAIVYRLMAQGAYIRWQGKNRDVIKRFLKKNPIGHVDAIPLSPSSRTGRGHQRTASRSLAYYSITHQSTGSRSPSMKRERYKAAGGVPMPSPIDSFQGAKPGLPSPSPKSTTSQQSFDFVTPTVPDSPSAASSCGSSSRQHMLANHARGPSDTSTVDFSEFSDGQESPKRSPKKQMMGPGRTHQRIHSDDSSLGFSETTSRFTL